MKPKPSKLARDKANPYSRYWRTKADEPFMAHYRGQPCELCRYERKHNTRNTCGHHLLPKSRCARHRFTPENMMVLCPRHHRTGKSIAAHSDSALVIQRFLLWLRQFHLDRYDWMMIHEWDSMGVKTDYRAVWEKYSGEDEL